MQEKPSMKRQLLVAMSMAVFLSIAADAARPSNVVEAASSTVGCDVFRVRVAGNNVDQPKPLVAYNLALSPPSGEPVIITDSFDVTPDRDGRFERTVERSWRTFGLVIEEGRYVLSGSAVLVSGVKPLSWVEISFSSPSLSCPAPSKR
jgi:hypothetical protein